MEYNREKVDEMVLGLLYLTMWTDKICTRAWKNIDFEVIDRLHEKGYIADPKGKAKSVVVSEEGLKKAKQIPCTAWIKR